MEEWSETRNGDGARCVLVSMRLGGVGERFFFEAQVGPAVQRLGLDCCDEEERSWRPIRARDCLLEFGQLLKGSF